ncbi:major facilitator superfamily domain-containing protein [Aspergillus stella-maris]|uniref:major facilitator superfamily domain-containing protein n=1 Tax=Aspergillus stella-maris TaxID=1810926 RepID=UPI003CCDC4DF
MSADVEERTQAASQADSPSGKRPHSPDTDADTEKAGSAPSGQTSWQQDAPDGGLEAWLCLATGIGTFQSFYSAQLLIDYSEGDISWIPSLQIFFMMAMVSDRQVLPKSCSRRASAVQSVLLLFFKLVCNSPCPDGATTSGVSLTCIPTWFNKNRGMAYGGIIFPILIEHLNHTRDQILQPLTEFAFMAVTIGIFLFTIGFFVLVTYLVVQAISDGMDPNLARYLVPILNGGSLLGRFLSGLTADKIGRYNTFILVCYITSILLLSLWIPASTSSAITSFTVLFGFFSNAYIFLIAALIVQISPMQEIGMRTALVFLLASVGGLTTGLMAGRIRWMD